MDDAWLERAIDWAVRHVDDVPTYQEAQIMIQSDDPSHKARASLALAQQSYLTEHGLRAARWQVANACNTLSAEAARAGDPDLQRDWLVIAVMLYDDLVSSDDRFSGSYVWAKERLAELGVEDWRASDPITGLDNPDAADMEEREYAPPPVVAASSAQSTEPRRRAIDIDLDKGIDHGLLELVAKWSGPNSFDSVIDGLGEYLSTTLAGVPIVDGALRDVQDDDIAFLREALGGAGLPVNGDYVLRFAQDARHLATNAPVNLTTEPYVRRRWLLAAAANYALWKTIDWHTNRPQVTWDVMGYVTTIQIARRFNDRERELLLALQELVVLLGATMPVAYLRFPQLPAWVLSATGTYLLIGGPRPVVPSESLTDPRVQGERRTHTSPDAGFFEAGRERRHRWPQVLLRRWRYDPDLCSSAAFALASLSGWEPATIEWLISLIFDPDGVIDATARAAERAELADDHEFWLNETLNVFGRAQPIRIASNPWAPSEADTSRSQSSVTSDAEGQLTVPSPVLRAMVAQLTDDDWSTTVQGELFRERRVPTYLLLNQYGPFGILKLDFADRVAREVDHFEQYASRLRPQYRPSRCTRGEYRLYVGDHPEPLQAILTTYVFEDHEGPTTVKTWIRTAEPERVTRFVSHLADTTLYPWLSHVSRRPIDLRMTYPLLRPHPAEHGEQSPNLCAATELPRLLASEVREALGVELSVDQATFDAAEGLARLVGTAAEEGLDGLVNPLWFVNEISERGSRAFDDSLYGANPLTAYNTLVTICHGDFHAENILCTMLDAALPRAVLIDFETTHEAHICRDFTRLEASLLTETIAWTDAQNIELLRWFGVALGDVVYSPPAYTDHDRDLACVIGAARELRSVVASCGQPRWPLVPEEYELGLLAALLPVVRYIVLPPQRRALALLLAAHVATSLTMRLRGRPAALAAG